MKKKTKTQSTLDKAEKYILENFDKFHLKIDEIIFAENLNAILEECRTLKNIKILDVILEAILNNLEIEEVKKFSDFNAFENKFLKIFNNFKLKNLIREDSIGSLVREKAIKLFYVANQEVEKFDKTFESYLEICKLAKKNSQFEEFKQIKSDELSELYKNDETILLRSVYFNDLINLLYTNFLDKDENAKKHWGIKE